MFRPRNVRSRFTVQATLPVAASIDDRSPLAPSAYSWLPSTIGVPRGPPPRSLSKRAPFCVSQTFLPVFASNAITYSLPSLAPRVYSRPCAAAKDEYPSPAPPARQARGGPPCGQVFIRPVSVEIPSRFLPRH